MKEQDIVKKALIFNKDLDALESSESFLSVKGYAMLNYVNAKETKIQQQCRAIFLSLAQEIKLKKREANLEFVQVDNGASLTMAGKIRKQREGTQAGFPDCQLILSTGDDKEVKVIFVEFKRVGTPSQVKISENQFKWHKKLLTMGFSAYITNNPFYFESVVCDEIRTFFK